MSFSYSYSYSLQLDDPRFLIRIKYVNADNYVIDRQRQKAKVYISALFIILKSSNCSEKFEQRYSAILRFSG